MKSLADKYHDEQGRPLEPTRPRPTPPPTTKEAVAQNRRGDAARKAAATVKARRQATAMTQATDRAVNDSIDRITAHVSAQAQTDRDQARRDALDPPGCPPARVLVATARSRGLEMDLFRQAHVRRAPWQASQWPAEIRTELGEWLDHQVVATEFRTKKGPKP
jgi:hypothetical protein